MPGYVLAAIGCILLLLALPTISHYVYLGFLYKKHRRARRTIKDLQDLVKSGGASADQRRKYDEAVALNESLDDDEPKQKRGISPAVRNRAA